MEECTLEKKFVSTEAYEYFKEYTLKNMRCIDSEWLKKNQLVFKIFLFKNISGH
jgi:hypothetical protein